jgi:hypothetical protein
VVRRVISVRIRKIARIAKMRTAIAIDTSIIMSPPKSISICRLTFKKFFVNLMCKYFF